MNIKKLLPVLFLSFLFMGCKEQNLVVFKGYDYSDWLTREIAEEYKVEFNLKDNTFLISETELSFPKESGLMEIEKVYYTKGNFAGNPEEDGNIKLFVQEYSDDNVNWIGDTYITSIDIVNDTFETEYYVLKRSISTKNHKKITKKIANYADTLQYIWENQEKKEKLTVVFEKAEKLATELLLLCDSEDWTQEDTFYLNRLNKTLTTYQTLFK